MKIVSNTTPIISLSSIGQLNLLQDIFQEILIPESVYCEIKAKKSYGYDEADAAFISVVPVKGKIYSELLMNQLDLGEAETIILAKEVDADYVLIDENIGYKIARNSGLEVIRTLTILLVAKEKKIIQAAKPLIDEMMLKGRWYSKTVYYNFLKKAGEI